MKTWINGIISPAGEASIDINDEGFKFGSGLFETIRIYHGNPAFLAEHIDRMFSSAEVLGYPLRYTKEELMKNAYSLISANEVIHGILRLSCTAGGTLLITTSDQVPYGEDLYKTGINAVITNVRRNETSIIVKHKTLNYLENIIAKREAASQGYQEVLFLNTKEKLAEGAVSNIFIVKNGTLITPDLESGLLPGIMRQIVLKLATDYPLEGRVVSVDELWSADECFITNSLMEIMPLVQINDQKINTGKPGIITYDLLKRYRELISQNKLQRLGV